MYLAESIQHKQIRIVKLIKLRPAMTCRLQMGLQGMFRSMTVEIGLTIRSNE